MRKDSGNVSGQQSSTFSRAVRIRLRKDLAGETLHGTVYRYEPLIGRNKSGVLKRPIVVSYRQAAVKPDLLSLMDLSCQPGHIVPAYGHLSCFVPDGGCHFSEPMENG